MILTQAPRQILRHVHTAAITHTCNSIRSRHTIAITREIPDSFTQAVVAHSSDQSNVSLTLARKQHQAYLDELCKHVPTVLCIPPSESHPDCVFVEDTVVAIGGTAVITQLGHPSRRGEVDSIKEILLHHIDGMSNFHDMRDDNVAFCDGGDVMYTGRHLFVGMSNRTNDDGYNFLRNAFAMDGTLNDEDIISVPPVVAGKEVLHLKSAVTHIDANTLLVPEGTVGDSVLDALKATERGYTDIRLPDILSCNAVVVNGHVLAQDAPCEVSKNRIEQACKERNLGLTFVDTSELAKKDGALTCCSVLLSV